MQTKSRRLIFVCGLILSTYTMTTFSFPKFYHSWFRHLQQLVHHLTTTARSPQTEVGQNHNLQHLINKVMSHFEAYYRAKSVAAEDDPLSVLVAPWSSTLERSLHWISGWRPTTAFHLVYTESSLLFESHINDILRGVHTGDLGDLSPTQFRRVSELQCDTVNEENAMTEELSQWQESGDLLLGDGADIDEKIGRLVSVIRKADDLRLRTMRSVIGLLTPQQSVDFLIGAAELIYGIQGWGANHDRPQHRTMI